MAFGVTAARALWPGRVQGLGKEVKGHMIEASLGSGNARLQISGELDWGAAMSLSRWLDDLASPGFELTIDLSDAVRISSAAFIALAGIGARVRAVGASMALVNVPSMFLGELALVGLVPTLGPPCPGKHEHVS